MSNIEKLNINYINKVMPTVYDDSLSYYEVLSKILYKLNEVINKISEIDILKEEINEVINKIPEIDEIINKIPEIGEVINKIPEIDNLKEEIDTVINKIPEIDTVINKIPEINTVINKIPEIDNLKEEINEVKNKIPEIENNKEEIDELKNKIPTIENSLNTKCEMKLVNTLPDDENLKNKTIYILDNHDNTYKFYFYIDNTLIELSNSNSIMNSLTLTNNVSDNLAIL